MALVTITTVSEQHCPLCAKPLRTKDASDACMRCKLEWAGEIPIVIRVRVRRSRWGLAELYEQAKKLDPWPSPETVALLTRPS